MPNLLYDALFRPHEGSGKTFLILKDGREISYAAFLAMAARFAHALAEAASMSATVSRCRRRSRRKRWPSMPPASRWARSSCR